MKIEITDDEYSLLMDCLDDAIEYGFTDHEWNYDDKIALRVLFKKLLISTFIRRICGEEE